MSGEALPLRPAGPIREDVIRARERLAGDVHETPVLTSRTLDLMVGCELYFKCENLQRSGSFKIRGALNAARMFLSESGAVESGGPLVTHSSGNHGAALALAGRETGLDVVVVVPENAPQAKKDNIARYGARLVFCGPTINDREAAVATELANGGHLVPPYNDSRVIAGQGTLGLEVAMQVPELQQLWVPVGGGGMASGCVLAVGQELQVTGTEPLLADDAYESLATGVLVGPRPPTTVADGLRGALGDITFALLRDYKLRIERVTDEQIVAAQRLLMECLKVVVEPSGAVPFAALLAAVERGHVAAQQRIALVISGGNMDL